MPDTPSFQIVAPDAPPPCLPSPLEPTAESEEIASAVRLMLTHPIDSPAHAEAADRYKLLTLRPLIGSIYVHKPPIFLSQWPTGLYIPAAADPRAFWPGGDPQRYARDWVDAPIGWGQASKDDGSLLAFAAGGSVRGALAGAVSAGVGVLFKATHTLSRLRLKPALTATGRHQWSAEADPVVWVNSRVSGSVLIGAFQANPVTGAWEPILNFTWRRHVVFDESNFGQGAGALINVPFGLDTDAVSGEVLVEGGRLYLLCVIAQAAINVTTEDSAGRPVRVTNGRFNTFGSLSGVLSELSVDEVVHIA